MRILAFSVLLVFSMALSGAAVPTGAIAQALTLRMPNPLPLTLRKDIAAMNADCRGYGGAPGKSPQLVRYADLTGDGIGDYVTDLGAYECQGAASAMSAGQSGADIAIYVGGPGNSATKVYENTVYGVSIENRGGRAHLFVNVAAALCGQRNAANIPFSNWTFCSRELVWNPARHSFAFAPMAQMRKIE